MEVSGGNQLKSIRHFLRLGVTRVSLSTRCDVQCTYLVSENPLTAEARRWVSSVSHAGRFRPRNARLFVSAKWNRRYIFIEYCSSFCNTEHSRRHSADSVRQHDASRLAWDARSTGHTGSTGR